MSIRPSNAAFHLPVDPTVPIVMFCAGSGFAPFRGFCQERAMQRKAGRETGKMLLFFGCRSPDEDFLYSAAELREWVDLGVVDLRPTFSRRPAQSEDCKYVQECVLIAHTRLGGVLTNLQPHSA
jgi:cytochrome P450/NADPH-cytochrome P450 reductase